MSSTLIGILGVVLGVLLSNVAVRILEYVRRRERIQDVSTAIRAEIRSHRQRLLLFKGGAAEHIVERILADKNYTPFVPSEGKSFILDAIVGEIHILPTEVIDAVVYYYRQIEALSQFAEDLRSDRSRVWKRCERPRCIETTSLWENTPSGSPTRQSAYWNSLQYPGLGPVGPEIGRGGGSG